MNWTDFEESGKEYPEKIVERAIAGFSKATKGLAELAIKELRDVARILTKLPADFVFNVRLVSPFVSGYSFKIITFGYDINLNPIMFTIDDEAIHKELYNELLEDESYIVCPNGEAFERILEKVFLSQKFIETVAGLMKIAKKYQ